MKKYAYQSQSGLSLLELIIALGLMTMIVVVSYPSLTTIIRSWNSIEFDITPTDQFAVERFIRHKVQQAALVFEKERSTRENLLEFRGQEDGFSFVSAMDDFPREPGLYLARIEIEEKNRQQSIVFEYQQYATQGTGESSLKKRSTLFEDISAATIDYYSNKERAWLSDWSDQKQLPALIRFQFTDARATTRRWVIDPKTAPNERRLTGL